MKEPKKTFDERRRELRRELLAKRNADRDDSPSRFKRDAEWLDKQLVAEGYELKYTTTWGD